MVKHANPKVKAAIGANVTNHASLPVEVADYLDSSVTDPAS